MNNVPEELFPKSDHEKFLGVPHDARWEHLKPVIVKLYTGPYGSKGRKTATRDQVVEFMKTHYSFHAAATEYPRHFRAWGVSKRVEKNVKDNILSALGRRQRPGTSASRVTIQQGDRTESCQPNKLIRHLKSKKPRAVEGMAPGLLSSWNLPYAAFVTSLAKNSDQPSPYGPHAPTPENVNIASPDGPEPPGNSPTTDIILRKIKEDHTNLFLQGRLKELVVRMSQEQRRTMFDYFHDFYMHGFLAAKNWDVDVSTFHTAQACAQTPQAWDSTNPWTPRMFLNLSPSTSPPDSPHRTRISSAPTQLCWWSIHVIELEYEPLEIDDPERHDLGPQHPFVESLRQLIAANNFSTTSESNLPIAREMIVQSIERDGAALELDAWKLAIMAGNLDLLKDLFLGARREYTGERLSESIATIHPFHLAAAYLDGGRTCCMIFATLCETLRFDYAFRYNFDNFGHTILDALMVSILRSHTNIHPEVVSYGFHSPHRFPGEEKDICGRWDADTPAVRELFKGGFARIPSAWKHPFCHTSVQAVCHSIICIFGRIVHPDIDTLSGLFVRRCTECGLELKLGPLHTVVVIAFYLAQLGMPEETLFGALAVMVTLLVFGADVSQETNVSVEEILGTAEPGKCHHACYSPVELMHAVSENVMESWTEDCRLGWICCRLVLANIEREIVLGPDDDLETDYCEIDEDVLPHTSWLDRPCRGPKLGLLWATIQAEFLTYRRVSEDKGWLSENFSMRALKTWLEGDSEAFLTPLVQLEMLKSHSKCGWFLCDSGEFVHPIAEDVCVQHFMNMDVHGRASYLHSPDIFNFR